MGPSARLPLLAFGLSVVAVALSVLALVRDAPERTDPGSRAGISHPAATEAAGPAVSPRSEAAPTLAGEPSPGRRGTDQAEQRIERLEALVAQATEKLGWLGKGQVQILYPRYPTADDRTEASGEGVVSYFQRLELPESFTSVILVERLVEGEWTRVRYRVEDKALFAYLVERRSDESAPRPDGRQDGVFRVTLTSDD